MWVFTGAITNTSRKGRRARFKKKWWLQLTIDGSMKNHEKRC
jgi:hypothetical protein